MNDLPTGSGPTLAAFRERARQAFAFLPLEYDFHEEPIPTERFTNPYAVWFANATTRVCVEGLNYGMTARVSIGSNQPQKRFENYDLGDLLAVRRDSTPSNPDWAARPSGQLEQLPYFAGLVRELGDDVLRGDHSIFPALAARVEWRRAELEAGRIPSG